jgi:hypothetical protein
MSTNSNHRKTITALALLTAASFTLAAPGCGKQEEKKPEDTSEQALDEVERSEVALNEAGCKFTRVAEGEGILRRQTDVAQLECLYDGPEAALRAAEALDRFVSACRKALGQSIGHRNKKLLEKSLQMARQESYSIRKAPKLEAARLAQKREEAPRLLTDARCTFTDSHYQCSEARDCLTGRKQVHALKQQVDRNESFNSDLNAVELAAGKQCDREQGELNTASQEIHQKTGMPLAQGELNSSCEWKAKDLTFAELEECVQTLQQVVAKPEIAGAIQGRKIRRVTFERERSGYELLESWTTEARLPCPGVTRDGLVQFFTTLPPAQDPARK